MAVVEPVLFIRDIGPSDLSASALEIRESSIQNLAVLPCVTYRGFGIALVRPLDYLGRR